MSNILSKTISAKIQHNFPSYSVVALYLAGFNKALPPNHINALSGICGTKATLVYPAEDGRYTISEVNINPEALQMLETIRYAIHIFQVPGNNVIISCNFCGIVSIFMLN